MYECETCPRLFNTIRARYQHMNALDHWAPRFLCDTCDETFFNIDDCNDHMDQQDHNRDDYQSCNRGFGSWNAAEQPMNSLGHWQHYCEDCERHFDNANNLQMHLRSHVHQGRNVPCPFCKRGFTTGSGVTHHLETGFCPNTRGVNRESIFKAVRQRDPNGMITETLLEWQEECWSTQNAWNGYGYECYLCHRQFAARQRLDQHLKSPAHLQDIYHCPNKLRCASKFKSLAALFNHLESESCGYIKFNAVQQSVGNFFSANQLLIGFN